MGYKDPDKLRAYKKDYYETNKAREKAKKKEYYEKNKEQKNEIDAKHREDRKQHAYNSITNGEIIDKKKWDIWCNNTIKHNATTNGHPYSDDFTNDIIFDMMVKGCFYCGDTIAMTIDRKDSKLGHTQDNCVGSCQGCNKSKGAADISTFVRKAYYRVRGEYYDDDINIWYIYKERPRMRGYKEKAKKKEVPFELSKEDFDVLTKSECAYCNRRPDKWFGIDRVVPILGYIIGNVVPCCCDCNTDKFEDDVDTMSARNERIVFRVIAGELIIDDCEKVILHRALTKPE